MANLHIYYGQRRVAIHSCLADITIRKKEALAMGTGTESGIGISTNSDGIALRLAAKEALRRGLLDKAVYERIIRELEDVEREVMKRKQDFIRKAEAAILAAGPGPS